jgi:hypothetical protein
MIIKSSRNNSKIIYKTEDKPVITEEVIPVIKENSHKKKNKKTIPTPIVEEPIVVEEKVEDEDLSQWLEEHTED